MIAYRRMFILAICLITLVIVVGPGFAAQDDPSALSPFYIPLVFNHFSLVGDQLAFIGVDPNNVANTYIYTIYEAGIGLTNLTMNPTPYLSFSWSPDGSRIVFSSYWPGNDDIYVMNADGSAQTRLTSDSASDKFPTWSPDGTRIAFSSNRQGSRQIYVMKADGSTVTRITNLSSGCSSQVWSPDGTRIAFDNFGTAFNNEEIYTVKPDASGLLRLTNNTSFDTVEGWSPDGLKILFRSNRFSIDSEDVFVMDYDGNNGSRLTSNGHAQAAAWSPDGTKIAWSESTAIPSLFIMNPDGSAKTEVLCGSNHIATFDFSWSLDGSKIAFSPSSGTGLYIVSIDGSACSPLTTMLASSPLWRP